MSVTNEAIELTMWSREKPVSLEIKATPGQVGDKNYTAVVLLVQGKKVVEHIPDFYPGDTLELTLRF